MRLAEDYNITADKYIILPKKITELNEYMCAPLDTKGVVCSLNVLRVLDIQLCHMSLGAQTVPMLGMVCPCTCSWSLIVPITVFYFILIFFQISMTSAPMLAHVHCTSFSG